jgi:hypothetical protein
MKTLVRIIPLNREYQFVVWFKIKLYDLLLNVISAAVWVGFLWFVGWLFFGHGTDLSE